MRKPGKKPVIGILGGIGSGKTTVAKQFGKLGCKVIDADKIAHELLEKKKVKNTVIGLFGLRIVGSNGKISRKKLAKIVFGDRRKLDSLNRILHPLVLARTDRLIRQYKGKKNVKAIVLDMPLLLEVGWAKRCDRLVFVACRADLRAKRAKKAGIRGKNELRKRENFQISLDKKAGIVDNIVDNNSGFALLSRQVADVLSSVIDNG